MPLLTTDVGIDGDGCMPAPILSVATYGKKCIVSFADVGANSYVIGLVRDDGLGTDKGLDFLFDPRYPDGTPAHDCGCPPSGAPDTNGDELDCDISLPIIHMVRELTKDETKDPTPYTWSRFAKRYRSNFIRCPAVTEELEPALDFSDANNGYRVNKLVSYGSRIAPQPTFTSPYTLEEGVQHRRGFFDEVWTSETPDASPSSTPSAFEFVPHPVDVAPLVNDRRGCAFNYKATTFSLDKWLADPPSWASAATPVILDKHKGLSGAKPANWNKYIKLTEYADWLHYWQFDPYYCADDNMGVSVEEASYTYTEDGDMYAGPVLDNLVLGKRLSTTRRYRQDTEDRTELLEKYTIHDGWFQQNTTDPDNIRLINPLIRIGNTWRFQMYMEPGETFCIRVQARYNFTDPYMTDDTKTLGQSYLALSKWSNVGCMTTGSFTGGGGSHIGMGKSKLLCLLWCGKDSIPFPVDDNATVYMDGDLQGNVDDLIPIAPGEYQVRFGFIYEEEYKDDDGVVLETDTVRLPPGDNKYKLIVPEDSDICDNGFSATCEEVAKLSKKFDMDGCELVAYDDPCSEDCDCISGCMDDTACNYNSEANYEPDGDDVCIPPDPSGYGTPYCDNDDIMRDYTDGGCNPTYTPELVSDCTCGCEAGSSTCNPTQTVGWFGSTFCCAGANSSNVCRYYQQSTCVYNPAYLVYQYCDICPCVSGACGTAVYDFSSYSFDRSQVFCSNCGVGGGASSLGYSTFASASGGSCISGSFGISVYCSIGTGDYDSANISGMKYKTCVFSPPTYGGYTVSVRMNSVRSRYGYIEGTLILNTSCTFSHCA